MKIINVGVGGMRGDLDDALSVLAKHGILPFLQPELQISDTELTLVAVVDASDASIYNACTALGEECIAVFDFVAPTGGYMVGPKCQGWAPFDPCKFLLPKGEWHVPS